MPIREYRTDTLPNAQVPVDPGKVTWVVSDNNGYLQSFNNREAAQIFEQNREADAVAQLAPAPEQQSSDPDGELDLSVSHESIRDEDAPDEESEAPKEQEVVLSQGENTPKPSEPTVEETTTATSTNKKRNTIKP